MKPVVGISACTVDVESHVYNGVMTKYIEAIASASDCAAVLIPAQSDGVKAVLPILDGVLLTGSYSNVHPSRYSDPEMPTDFRLDEERDATTPNRLNSIHCIARASTVSPTGCSSKGGRLTDSWKQCRFPTNALLSVCNGIRNGGLTRIRFRVFCFAPSAMRVANIAQQDKPRPAKSPIS